ncbi:MAG: hypothetical protein RIA69_14090 [Cyclobacteriaceae bacterium]
MLAHNTGYESLKEAGVRLITNDSLRDHITTLFQEDLYGTEQLDRSYRNQLEQLQNFVNVDFYEATRPFDINRPDLIGEMKPKNAELLKSDPQPIYHMKTLRNNNELNINLFMIPLRAQIVKIIEEIELELEKE